MPVPVEDQTLWTYDPPPPSGEDPDLYQHEGPPQVINDNVSEPEE